MCDNTYSEGKLIAMDVISHGDKRRDANRRRNWVNRRIYLTAQVVATVDAVLMDF